MNTNWPDSGQFSSGVGGKKCTRNWRLTGRCSGWPFLWRWGTSLLLRHPALDQSHRVRPRSGWSSRGSLPEFSTDCRIAFGGEAVIRPASDARLAVEILGGLQGREISLGAGAGRRDRRVIAQVGEPLPIGAKSAVYRKEFGNYTTCGTSSRGAARRAFSGPCFLPERWRRTIRSRSWSSPNPMSTACRSRRISRGWPRRKGSLRSPSASILRSLRCADPNPRPIPAEGSETPSGLSRSSRSAAGRGRHRQPDRGFADVEKLEKEGTNDNHLIEISLGTKNNMHNNYQDFQAFLETEAGSACSMIRCFTAPTTSTRSS